jgi:Raf kinase inhibitor-like YbhB/YbcL family protein
MNAYSTGIINGIIEDKYGKRGTQFNVGDMPTYSLPVKIENEPKGTISFAIVLEDKDAIPVFGFSWIQWTVANLIRNEVMENESISATDFIQGANSWYGALGGVSVKDASFYGGMAPPDAPHTYEMHVYALDTKLNLKNGFFMNELYKAMEGHILEQVTIKGVYYD